MEETQSGQNNFFYQRKYTYSGNVTIISAANNSFAQHLKISLNRQNSEKNYQNMI